MFSQSSCVTVLPRQRFFSDHKFLVVIQILKTELREFQFGKISIVEVGESCTVSFNSDTTFLNPFIQKQSQINSAHKYVESKHLRCELLWTAGLSFAGCGMLLLSSFCWTHIQKIPVDTSFCREIYTHKPGSTGYIENVLFFSIISVVYPSRSIVGNLGMKWWNILFGWAISCIVYADNTPSILAFTL